MHIQNITSHLKSRLREAGPSRFEEISRQTGVTLSFIRKFVYGTRENPRVQTVQPLLDYFSPVDRGETTMAELTAPKATV